MRRTQPLARAVLDLVFVIALVSLLLTGRLGGTLPDPRLIVTLAVAALVCWLILRTREGVWALVILWLVAYGALLLFEPTMLMVAVLLVFVRYGVRVGVRSVLIGLAIIEVCWVVAHLIDWGRPLGQTAFFMVSTVGYLGVPVVLGIALSSLQGSGGRLAATNGDLQDANAELAAQSLLAQDLLLIEERARASRELHDGLGEQLAAAAASIDRTRLIGDLDEQSARLELGRARNGIGSALGELRIWVRAMNPANRASKLGLAGLNDVAASFRGTGLRVEVDVPTTHQPLGERTELYVVRFVQEGLTNAVRHGRASRVWVGAQLRSDELALDLTDDGQGASGVPTDGFGLRSLRERADELGGRFEASAAPAGGFRIRAWLPLSASRMAFASAQLGGLR